MAAENLDYALALSLQDQFDREAVTVKQCSRVPKPSSSYSASDSLQGPSEYNPRKIVDGSWELVDPSPNIHDLFVQFDQMFFNRKLVSSGVVVSWSNRMTLCAGVCSYRGREGFCSIRLSEKLLKLRPRRDLVETLLHEMIHAYLFVTHNNTDHDGHGPNFQAHMNRINDQTGTKITIYHTFHDEVREYRNHWWKCNGPCQKRPPFFGVVRRAMNRAPSRHDPWWAEHQKTCGGTYLKIKEPEGYKKKGGKKVKEDSGHILNGEQNKTNSKRIQKTFDADKNKKINDIFPKVTPKTKIEIIPVKETTDEKRLVDSSIVERRNKMLAAAKKRQAESEMRGKGTKRTLITQSTNGARQYDSVYKRTKLENETKKGHSSSASPISDNLEPSTIIDLCEDDLICSSEPFQGTSSQAQCDDTDCKGVNLLEDPHPSGGGLDDDVVIVDGEEFRTCPVCGMNTLPAAIINAHVAFCLEEDDWEKIND